MGRKDDVKEIDNNDRIVFSFYRLNMAFIKLQKFSSVFVATGKLTYWFQDF
jgi:hypothetical protein